MSQSRAQQSAPVLNPNALSFQPKSNAGCAGQIPAHLSSGEIQHRKPETERDSRLKDDGSQISGTVVHHHYHTHDTPHKPPSNSASTQALGLLGYSEETDSTSRGAWGQSAVGKGKQIPPIERPQRSAQGIETSRQNPNQTQHTQSIDPGPKPSSYKSTSTNLANASNNSNLLVPNDSENEATTIIFLPPGQKRIKTHYFFVNYFSLKTKANLADILQYAREVLVDLSIIDTEMWLLHARHKGLKEEWENILHLGRPSIVVTDSMKDQLTAFYQRFRKNVVSLYGYEWDKVQYDTESIQQTSTYVATVSFCIGQMKTQNQKQKIDRTSPSSFEDHRSYLATSFFHLG